jgi:3-oxoadipate enol-lactonase
VPSLGRYADDAAAVLDRLGLARATIVGLSLGGLVAQALAIRHPSAANAERVEAVAASEARTVATVTGWLAAPSAAEEGLASEAITAEALVVGGGADDLCPPAAVDALADAIAGARRAVIPDFGHLMNLEQPDAFTDLVRSVLP